MQNKYTQRATIKKLHYVSGITLSIFIAFHLLNHLFALGGPQVHIQVMEAFRKVYRNPLIETLLLLAIAFQIATGLRLAFRRNAVSGAEKVQVYSGLYLAFFLLAHVGAVISGRYVQHLDTNFYYGAVGLNFNPAIYIFVPYYFLGVVAISLHVASIHYQKTGNRNVSFAIAGLGTAAATVIIMAFTGNFSGLEMPAAYVNFMKDFFHK